MIKKLWLLITGTKSQMEYLRQFREELRWNGCPCKHTSPCSARCTCNNSSSSFGCRRCATYGSKEQQRVAAQRLAAKIDYEH